MSAVIKSRIFCTYGFKNDVVKEAKIKMPPNAWKRVKFWAVQQRLISRRFSALFAYELWSSLNSARSVSQSAYVMSDCHFTTESICGHAICILY